MSVARIDLATAAGRLNPFPGLRPFEPDEDYLFFGRERQVDELLRRLRTTRFLSIIGTSGCGKSSLVRAGLIPSLYGGAMSRAGSRWRVAILRPGEDPVGNLAAALAEPETLGEEGDEEGLTRAFFETTLRASKLGLVECIRQARLPERDNVLVLVDQFEELFRFKGSHSSAGHEESIAFVKLLIEAARQREVPCYLALTMRSDFIGNCMEFADLPEMINAGLYLVPRMTRDELRSAITGPVAVGGTAIAPRLVSRLLNDVGDDPDQLPILQHALARTWRMWERDRAPGEPLDLRHYEAIGTMNEALSRHAEEAYSELNAEGQRIAEVMFKALTDKGTDERGIRRPAPVAEISTLAGTSPEQVIAVVERFRRPGRSFLMPPFLVPLQPGSILDISHESLMRLWVRLTDWVKEEARSAHLYLGAARAAARHEEGTSALWRDPELQIALTWRARQNPTEEWARRYDPSFKRAMAFLDASKAERDREIAEREARRQRTLRYALIVAVALGAASLATLAFAFYAKRQAWLAEAAQKKEEAASELAMEQSRRALLQKAAAERARVEAVQASRRAEQQAQITEEQRQIAEEQRQLAEVQRRRAESEERQARDNEARANQASREAARQRNTAERERQAADDERHKAQASEQEARRLGRLSAARALALQLLRPVPEDRRELAALLALEVYRLNRDNGGGREDPDLFNALRATLGGLRRGPVFGGLQDGVRALAVAPDGTTVFSGSEDGRILRFDLAHPEAPPASLGAFGSGVRSLALGAGGRSLAAGFADGALELWDLSRPGSPPRELAAGGAVLGALAFAPRGSQLAAGRADGAVSLFDLAQPDAAPVALDAKGRRVSALAFSPDGRELAAGLAQGGGALLWAVRPDAVASRTACDGKDVRSVAFSPDGRLLACGGGRGEITLWDLAGGSATGSLAAHASSVNSLDFSPHGDVLASASSDSTVRLWELASPGAQPIVLAGHESWVWSAAFTPDGDRVVSGGADRTVRLWAARTDVMAGELCRAVHRELTRDEWSRYLPPDLDYPKEQRLCPVGR